MGPRVLPKSVCGRVVPPNPMGIKRFEPVPKGGGQLVVGVTREDKEGLEHGLSGCFGVVAGGFDIGPAMSAKGVGLELAVPHVQEDVGACCIAHVRQAGDSHVEPDLIEELATGQLPLFFHHDLVDGQVKGSTWGDGSQGAFE